jgi:tRNA(Ile)-lysidine synthase
MIDEFIQHNNKNELFDRNDRILLTISGGIDSMTMFYLFLGQEYNIGVAHCNFMLRGKESDLDQEFVRNLTSRNNVEYHTINFNTSQEAAVKKISIQMAARELRYDWFNQIAQKYSYSKIATAHNLNDLAETFLINLSRGTGIKGLTGIPVKSGKIIRPLLFATREKIYSYANRNKINYREDSSNAETKYLRNAIRHDIIKEFEKITPNFLHGVQTTTKLLHTTQTVYDEKINLLRNQLFIPIDEHETQISINQLKDNHIQAEMLFDILLPFNFTYDNCAKILSSINSQSGICFYTSTHRLIKDRAKLIISKVKEKNNDVFEINDIDNHLHLPIKFNISEIHPVNLKSLKLPKNKAIFDAEKIFFPLKLRRWKKGDYFYPFGMNGRKKVSDYFSDNKFSINDKENAWLLTSGEDVIWIVNHRTDNRFRITDNTKKILLFETGHS